MTIRLSGWLALAVGGIFAITGNGIPPWLPMLSPWSISATRCGWISVGNCSPISHKDVARPLISSGDRSRRSG